MHNTSLLVLTGGTVAGKSSVLTLLSTALSDQAIFIGETGTKILARAEFHPPHASLKSKKWYEWQLRLQKQIFKEQRQAEQEALKKATREKKQLVITDRGTPDCWIWLSDPAVRYFEKGTGTTIKEEFNRYSTAIYLPSLSVVSKELFLRYRRNNPSRLPRSWKSAQEVEAKTRNIWSSCDKVLLIRGDLSIEEKVQDIMCICNKFLKRDVSSKPSWPSSPHIRKLES